jgi:dihydropteroate synthase/2-amino-4-hydroxy-6-hydroxymethyldihydropteridine diphosphokinase
MSSRIFLGLGTNLGNRYRNLQRALTALSTFVTITAVSPVYESAAWGFTSQPDFLNLCLGGQTTLAPHELLAAAKQVERDLGREPTHRWGPRLIDIDLLLYDDLVLQTEPLALPHPSLPERAFVLAPLADIAPEIVHPVTGQTIQEMLAALDTSSLRRLEGVMHHQGGQIARRKTPDWGARTYVMGILNVTPDSFSGDGVLRRDDWLQAAVAQARQFVADGADILDVGGESTRPGSTPVTEAQELARVLPVIEAVRAVVEVLISVDTYRSAVAGAALAAGADWINDVWAMRMDPDMAGLIAGAGCPVALMHNRSKPKDVAQEERLGGRYIGVAYDDLIEDIKRELQESIDLALAAGVQPEQIILDPGVGFGKTVSQNLQLINELHYFRAPGYPILLGPSRKSFIGYTLNLPPEERLEGTAAAVAVGIARGADIVRVHDVKPMVRVARMTDSIVRKKLSDTSRQLKAEK